MKKTTILLLFFLLPFITSSANPFDNPDTIVVARDGTGQFRNIGDAIEVCRAFMDYHKVILIKRGTYKEKLTIPSWLDNIELLGEDRDQTIITFDDHANILMANGQHTSSANSQHTIGTFRTFTLKIQGNNISLKNLTVENNAARLGQAVALHTEGDHLRFVNCRFLGHQDTVYTGKANTHLLFEDCYIEGTTDFIFGPSTAWFEHCHIHSRANSYVTAASTPPDQPFGYVFSHCRLTADEGIDQVYLGRPWRPHAYTLFIYSELGSHIVPAGWHNWNNPANEQTARYMEYQNSGPGASPKSRAAWSRQLTKREAAQITRQQVIGM